MPTVCLR